MTHNPLHLIVGVVLLAGCAAAPRAATVAEAPAPRIETDAAADSLLCPVRQSDSTIRVELRYATSNNFTGDTLPGYEANRAFLRCEAAAALGRVQSALRPQGLGLLIWDGYRPVRASQAMVRWAERVGKTDLLGGYIARRSRHNLGVAVDLTLVNLQTGEPLEMGTPFDTFSPAAHTANASGVAKENRQKLVKAMEKEGFVNYTQEWWHFSYPIENPPAFDRVIR